MGKKRTYTITEVMRNSKLFSTAVPFDITVNGQIVATVISPNKVEWRECENCGQNTQNIIEFQDEKSEWNQIVLCDQCSNELI
jgi:hypothetical protein